VTSAGTTLEQKLAEATREADSLRDQLAAVDSELNQALEDRRYGDETEGLKHDADALRQSLYIADATVTALQAAVQQLADHQAAQQRAAFERDRKDQALGQYDQAKQREAAAEEGLDRFMAEIAPSWGALADTMIAAIDAERRITQARRDAHETGKVAGHFHPDSPIPAGVNRASALIENNRVLVEVLRNPRLTP
jgi:chromosome segregation ATPase